MFFFTPLCLLLLGVPINAFPTLDHINQLEGGDLNVNVLAELISRQGEFENTKRQSIFDAASLLVDVSGAHAFVAPDFAAGDIRGPCPGLNVLANHGYLPHNGVADILQYTTAVNSVFNMGLDLGGALAVFGTAVAGNAVSLDPGYSMGGKTSNSQNVLGNLLGLLGEPVGLSGTHGQYEEDSSSTRGDLYVTGNNYELVMSQFLALYDLQIDAAQPNYSMDVILEHNINRYYESVNTNPYFWYGPIGGTIIRNAAYAFSGRLFANYSAEYPTEGRLSKETLKSFYAVSGEEGSFVYSPGCERIPENYYHRPTPYGVANFAADLLAWSEKYPLLLNAGGNTGKVNSFVGLDVENLTGGALNAQTLLQGNNAVCLGLELLIEFSPSLLHSLYTTITAPLQNITNAFGSAVTSLNCPQLTTANNGGMNILNGFKDTYPGVAKAGWGI